MNAPVPANEDLLYKVEDGIAHLTFNRPQARNALTFAMYERMAAICGEVNADHSIKAMILTGAGDKAFASGTDISQFRAFKTAQDALDYEARIDRVGFAEQSAEFSRRVAQRGALLRPQPLVALARHLKADGAGEQGRAHGEGREHDD